MKHKWIYIVVLVIMLIAIRMWSKYSVFDGVGGMICASLPFGEDTVYAVGYTEKGFESIEVGMSHQEVHEILGAPLDIWTNNNASTGERWSKSPESNNYRCRVITFNDDTVEEIHAEFYFD